MRETDRQHAKQKNTYTHTHTQKKKLMYKNHINIRTSDELEQISVFTLLMILRQEDTHICRQACHGTELK